MSKIINKSNKAISFLLSLTVLAFTFFCTPIVTPVVSAAPTTTGDGGSGVVVSLGDSFSSGEGIPEFYGQNLPVEQKVEEDDWLAHRSTKSWPGQLKVPDANGNIRTLADTKDTTWFFEAASGAETKHITSTFDKPYKKVIGYTLDGYPLYHTGTGHLDQQIDVFEEVRNRGLEVEYVTMTLSGNDANFAGIIKDAVLSSITTPNFVSHEIQKSFNEFYKDGGIRDKLYETYKRIEKEAGPQAKIIVVGYPKLLNADGKGLLFTKEVATIVNNAVTRFNDEIETLVNQCKAEGMKICFVDVEKHFETHEAYSTDEWIQGVKILAKSEDLKDTDITSSYSMHPNEEGARQYAKCVQKKIDSIEADGGKSEWPLLSSSEERDVVLVLDASGSMSGTPMEETKKASKKFITTVFEQDASVGIVTYNSSAHKVANFCRNTQYLNNIIDALNTGSSTNIEDGLKQAEEMLKTSKAKKKLIVLMSDGLPNDGKEGDDLIAYANQLKSQGIYIYTLGFFSAVESSYKDEAQHLMEAIASEGCHFEVDNADDLVYFFEDIASQIQGQKYIYVKIACPVDVVVEYNGEKLSSKGAESGQRTEFGTLTFEENPNESEKNSKSDTRIKVLRLKEGAQYDIQIEGNGKGKMDYTIGFMDENGEYSDMREFRNIQITNDTQIDTVAAVSEMTYLKVDSDGDGKYDLIYRADKDQKAILIDSNLLTIIIVIISSITALLIIEIVIRKITRNYVPKQKPVMAMATPQGNAGLYKTPPTTFPTQQKPAQPIAQKPNPIAQKPSPIQQKSIQQNPAPVQQRPLTNVQKPVQQKPSPIQQKPVSPPPKPAMQNNLQNNATVKKVFCTKCGKQVDPNAKFCKYCGKTM